LHLAIILVAVGAIQREDWTDDLSILTPLATAAVLQGFLLAKTRITDLAAHLLSFVAAVVASVAMTVLTMDVAEEGLRARTGILWDRTRDWFSQVQTGRGADDTELFVLLMGITVWLIAYSSAWMLYRRHWLIASLLLPGGVLAINFAYATDSSPRPIFLYGFASCLLAARFHAYQRQAEWSRSRIHSPDQLPWHFVRGGLTVTAIAVLLAWSLPADAPDPVLDNVADRLEQPITAVQDKWNDWMDNFGNSPRRGGRFATFNESFRLGGDLNLSEEEVALVTSSRPVYLAAHRYNRYDGHGWSTDVESTFRGEGGTSEDWAPLVTFEPDNEVFLSSAVTQERDNESATVKVLKPKGDLIFTVETYLSTTERASVQLGWQQLVDDRFPIAGADVNAQPVDLREFIGLLRQTTFTVDESTGEWVATDPAQEELIEQKQKDLRDRHLDVTWETNQAGQAETLIVNGQIPVYDDVEAVRVEDDPEEGQEYGVSGLVSLASEDALRNSPVGDPSFVTSRYLGNPTTVTSETIDLARQLAAGRTNRFDKVVAIQEYLRQTFPYDEQVDVAPPDRDAVDYFLFEGKKGYCEYFASAMVVMLRSIDVPARLVAGYHSAPFDPDAGGYLYREKQAHTWVEVYFPEYGWIPFEPTPPFDRFSLGSDEETAPSPTAEPTQPPNEPTATATLVPTPAATPAPNTITEPSDPDQGASTAERILTALGKAVAAVVLIIMLIALFASAMWHWKLRGLRPGAAMFARIQRVGKWWGVKPDASMTPVEFARELGRVAPSVRRPARIVAELYETEQYGGRPPDPSATRAAKRAWTDARSSLLRSLPRWRKRRKT
jgi:hypothetical protein